jgi:hypothetical protein
MLLLGEREQREGNGCQDSRRWNPQCWARSCGRRQVLERGKPVRRVELDFRVFMWERGFLESEL